MLKPWVGDGRVAGRLRNTDPRAAFSFKNRKITDPFCAALVFNLAAAPPLKI